MQPYQEEYIANVKEYISLNLRPGPEDQTAEDYTQRILTRRGRKRQLWQRNMELLREKLLPEVDYISAADGEARRNLQEFSVKLLFNPGQVDIGLACRIQQAMVSLARQEENWFDLVEHLYWLGRSWFALSSKLVNMADAADRCYAQVRECFEEASAFLAVFDQMENEDTRSYIIRSTANQALGQFPTVGERTGRLKEALEVMEHPYYRSLAPELPWDEYIVQTHRLMVSSISCSRDRAMTDMDAADIMRSVYIVYPDSEPSPRQAFHCAALEFYCGAQGLEPVLNQLERLIDAADPRDFSPDGMYPLISLPAYYCMYMAEYPEQLTQRRRLYIGGLHRRIRSYLNAIPPDQEGEDLFFYLRQFIRTFMEVDQGIPFRDFLLWLICRFAPELYIHSRTVAELAKVLSGSLLDRDGAFFDEISFLCGISDPAKKRTAVLEYAEGCGLFHDAGKINCLELHTRVPRRWFPVEDEMARLHTVSGHTLMLNRASTSRYAVAALGHHTWYNGDPAFGSPAAYRREECPERRMVDVIALANWLANSLDEYQMGSPPHYPFAEAVQAAVSQGGQQFSPHVTALLEEESVQAALQQALADAADKAYRTLYQRGST